MKTDKYFLNKKYKLFLFFPLASIAVFYLIGVTEVSYIFNLQMVMSPMQAGMPMQVAQAAGKQIKGMEKASPLSFLKIVSRHPNKLNLQSYITCVECQNLPAAYYPALFYYYSFIKIISSTEKSYIKHFPFDIPHPPQNILI